MAKRGIDESDIMGDGWGEKSELTVEQWGIAEYEEGRRHGISEGAGKVLRLMRQRASTQFLAGKDDEALALRTLADDIAAECLKS